MKRVRIRRKTSLKRRVRLRVKSEKQDEKDELHAYLRQVALIRDGFKCRKCGASPQAHVTRASTTVLQAAHIYGKGAHPAMRFLLDNVLILCKSCHYWWHRTGFGREAAYGAGARRENPVRRWCVSEIGEAKMQELDLIAATWKGPCDIDLARAVLEREMERLTTPRPMDLHDARLPREFDL